MRLYKSIVSAALLATFALLPGCGQAPMATTPAVVSAAGVEAMGAYPIEEITGVGAVYGKKLRKAGITTAETFAAATGSIEQTQQLAAELGVSLKLVQGWAAQADLMAVKGIGPRAAALLAAVGMGSIGDLAAANAADLGDKVGIANAFEPRFLANTPSLATVAAWVTQAQAIAAEREAGNRANALQATYGLNAIYVKKLNDGGVADAEALKAAIATKKGREKLSKASGLPYPWLVILAGKANMMTLEGVGLGEAKLLAAVGVTTVRQLAKALPSDLQHRMALANASTPRFVEKTPTNEMVAAWVKAAQKLAPTLDEK